MTTTQELFHVLLVVGFFLLVAAAAWLYPKVKDRLSPTQPDTAGNDDREASGADEQFAGELHAMRNAPAPVDLPLKAAEQMVVDHEALAAISAALDEFDRTVSDALSRFLRNQPTVLLRLPASVEQTGELPVVELVGA